MVISLDSLGFDDVPKTAAAQLAEFKKLGAQYGVEALRCPFISGSYSVAWSGTEENLRKLIDDCYGGTDELLDLYGLESFAELAD